VKALLFALRALPRDLRTREIRVLAAALAVAVGAVASVGFFTDRVDHALERRATNLLGGDLLVEADDPLDATWQAHASDLGLRTTTYVTFASVVVAGDHTELVAVKAVGPHYPLRGRVRIAAAPYGHGQEIDHIPRRGSVWLDPRLFSRLGVSTGDRIPIGSREFRIAGSLAYEPDRAGSLFQLAPRVMLARADLPSTGLISAASRADYHLLVAGSADAVARFRAWMSARSPRGVEIRDVRDARPAMRRALDRAGSFLALAAILAVILAGAAVAVTVHALGRRESDTSALLRCFGASQRLVLTSLLLRLVLVGLIASGVGVGIGWIAQDGLVALVGSWFGEALPAPSGWPALAGLGTGLVTLVGFGLIPALRIRRVPVLRVLRQDQAAPEPSALAAVALAIGAIALLIVRAAADPKLAGWVLGGTLGMLVALGGSAWLLVRLVGRMRGRSVTGWRFGLASIARRNRTSAVQLVGFGLGLLALLLLAVVRVDVLQAWRHDVPPHAPNQFMINVQPGDVAAVRERLAAAGVDSAGFYPMIRGRLIAINGKKVDPNDYTEGRARHLAQREFNLSYATSHRPDNTIVAGQWWSSPAQQARPLLSVEKGIAEDLGIALGDRLTFRVAGEDFSATVSNLRRVDWDSFKANFFVVATPMTLRGMPETWITSYWLPPGRGDRIAQLVRDHPGITVIDVGQILDQVRAIIDQGTRAVEYVFAFTLLAGVIVLLAAVQASRDERRVEIALLRTLGASRRRVRVILAAEFGALGILAGIIAATGAALTGWAVTTQVLDLPYHFNPWLFVIGVTGGAAGIALAGLAATRRLVTERPLAVLRGA